jgi:hypothetical protein
MASQGAKAEKKAAGAGPNQLTEAFGRQLSMASRSVHADDYTNTHAAVAPPMHVSTTFRYPRNPDELLPWSDQDVSPPFLIPRPIPLTPSPSPTTQMTSTSTRATNRPPPPATRPS